MNPVPIGQRGRTTPRPMSVVGFCSFVGISRTTFYNLKNNPEMSDIVQRVVDAIDTDTITGGLTRQYDSNFSARLANVRDGIDTTTTDATDNNLKNFMRLPHGFESETDVLAKLAVYIHPDDPINLRDHDPLAHMRWPRPMFSEAQLEQGFPFPAGWDDVE